MKCTSVQQSPSCRRGRTRASWSKATVPKDLTLMETQCLDRVLCSRLLSSNGMWDCCANSFSLFYLVILLCVVIFKSDSLLQVGTNKDITEESVSLFHMLEPTLGKKNQKHPHLGQTVIPFVWYANFLTRFTYFLLFLQRSWCWAQVQSLNKSILRCLPCSRRKASPWRFRTR